MGRALCVRAAREASRSSDLVLRVCRGPVLQYFVLCGPVHGYAVVTRTCAFAFTLINIIQTLVMHQNMRSCDSQNIHLQLYDRTPTDL